VAEVPQAVVPGITPRAAPLPALDGGVVLGPVRIHRPRPGEIVAGDGLVRLRATTGLADLRQVDVAITARERLVRLVRLPVRNGMIAAWIRLETRPAPVALRLAIRAGDAAGSEAASLAEIPLLQEAVPPLWITAPWLPGGELAPGPFVVGGRVAPGISDVRVRLERPRGRSLVSALVRVAVDRTHAPAIHFFTVRLHVPDRLRPGMYWIIASGDEPVSGRQVSDAMSAVVRAGG
jgi:hypothetical protein